MTAAALLLGGLSGGTALAETVEYPSSLSNPFKLGVASGDPFYANGSAGIVLWTRLAPNPLNGGGMPNSDVPVYWQIAKDGSFSQSLKEGTATATPGLGHSVHAEVTGLEPGTYYYYRFRVGKKSDGTFAYDSWNLHRGRTKTMPASGASLSSMTFAVASCQNWQWGLYPAYGDIANQNLDLVVHLGDYTYEYGPTTGYARVHKTAAPKDLLGYRNRHAEHKTDTNLQKAHAAHPWVVTWDDHEVQNDYAGTYSWYDTSSDFAKRRAAAYQAYYEHMPMRLSSLQLQNTVSSGWASMPLYRRLAYGNLAQLSLLDTRQYRSKQPSSYTLSNTSNRFSTTQIMTGGTQENWLKTALTSSGPRWNVIANQVIMFEYDHTAGSGQSYYMDGWDGYVAARNRILKHLYEAKPRNPIVITGDMHSSWVANLRYHPTYPNYSFRRSDSVTVGTEFTGPGISSYLSQSWKDTYRNALSDNPHVKYLDTRSSGYVRCTVTPQYWQSDFRLASNPNYSTSSVSTISSWRVYDGRLGAVRV